MASVLSSYGRRQGQGQGLKDRIICTNTNKGVKKLLECPICLEICIPPIFQCDVGHHICEKCKNSVTQCPICRAKIQGTRNFFLENYFEQNCHFSCLFAKEGCKEMVAGKDLKTHQEKCTFRPVSSVSVPCHLCKSQDPTMSSNLIPMSDYLAHLIKDHNATYSFGSSVTGEITFPLLWSDVLSHINRMPASIMTPWINSFLLKFHGFTFVLVNTLQNFDLVFRVSILGNENEANQFYVQFSIETETNLQFQGIKMSQKIAQLIGSVIPINCSSETAIAEYENSKLVYNINLLRVCANLKPETKFKLTFKLVKKKCSSLRDLEVTFFQFISTDPFKSRILRVFE